MLCCFGCTVLQEHFRCSSADIIAWACPGYCCVGQQWFTLWPSLPLLPNRNCLQTVCHSRASAGVTVIMTLEQWLDTSLDPAADAGGHDWVPTLILAYVRLCRASSRGEQGRPEDEAAEAAETGTATQARSLASASIPEHPSAQVAHQNGTDPSAADLSSLAGADVSLMHGESPQLADRDLPAASAGSSTGADAAAGSPAELSGRHVVLPAADPSTGRDTVAGPMGGTDGSVPRGAPGPATGARDTVTSTGGAGAGTDVRRLVTLNPLYEPEAADDGPPPQAAYSYESSAEPAVQEEDAQAGQAGSAADSTPGALQSSSQALGEGSGHMRVRHCSSEAHPSILRHSTWTDPDTAATGSDAERQSAARPDGS